MNENEATIDNEEEIDNTEVEETEVDLDEGSEDGSENQESDSQSVPLNVYLDMKTKYKETRKKLQSLEDINTDSEILNYKNSLKEEYNKLVDNEELAEKIANDIANLKMSFKNDRPNKFSWVDDEIRDLKTDPIFSDIEDYREEIIEKVKETKKKGFDLDVEDAYLLVSRTDKRGKLRDKKTNNTQREVIKNKSTTGKGSNVTTSQGGTPKPKYVLDEDDKKALKELQRYQPDAKWTVEKYYKSMKE